jgi:C_GCAxxG_C_C family probable redox protein
MPARAARSRGQTPPTAAVARARRLFLDDAGAYGCAETSYLALADAFGLTEVVSSAPAMALNGGVAYGGGICGAISGAALAVGLLAERRIPDHRVAKRVARELVAEAMDRFAERHGALDCRDLIGVDLRAPGEHDAFMASGRWRVECMVRIEDVLADLAPLADRSTWDAAVARLPV